MGDFMCDFILISDAFQTDRWFFPALRFAIFGTAAHRKHTLTKRAGADPWANPNVVFVIYPRRIQSFDILMFPVDFRSDFIFVSCVFQVIGHVVGRKFWC